MAKKVANKTSKPAAAGAAKVAVIPAAVDPTVVKTTAPRNSPIPKVDPIAAAPKKEVTYEAIAQRAYEIYTSGTGGSETDNWLRAERELKGL